MEAHHHRSGSKQSNKTFKSRHATKGQNKAKSKGKVDTTSKIVPPKSVYSQNKANRKNQAKLLQQKKREELISSNRLFMGASGAPKIVAIIPLCPDIISQDVVKSFFDSMGMDFPIQNGPIVLNIVDRFKQKLQFIPLKRNLFDILDAVKVADYVLFVVSASVEVDKFGDLCIATIKSQGIPSIFHAVQHLEKVDEKLRFDDIINLVRNIINERPKTVVWRDRYSYLLGEELRFEPNDNNENGTLYVKGFVRGKHLNVNRLVHIPNLGDFQIKAISTCQVFSSHNQMDEDLDVFYPDKDKQESLLTENVPDPMEGEQTWPTEEEIEEADERVKAMSDQMERTKFLKKKLVPKGTSAYQAAWIIDSEPEDNDDEDEDENMNDSGYSWPAGEKSTRDDDDVEEELEELVEESVMGGGSIHHIDLEENEELRQYEEYKAKQKAERDDAEFPDEIDTPKEIMAKTRFQRYRGLKSFKKSPWDPYENLPVDFARIFQFKNFSRSKKKVLSNLDDGVNFGTYVDIQIQDVPKQNFETKPTRPFIIFSLLPYEQKTTILNFLIQRPQPTSPSSMTEPQESLTFTGLVKNKDPVILCCGFRRYIVNPTYSSHGHTSNNVHKMERFLRIGKPTVATIFGPIQFGPAPIMLMKYNATGNSQEPQLIATGSLLDLDVKRIIAKRMILTGHPFKIHRRSAVVRYMFFNPEDISYFKPVQLVTKHGLVGHIRDSVGTHGYMKCLFDKPLTQQDTGTSKKFADDLQ
ncbi:hypothetical protein HK096_009670 [Nowakowskiella sp. JEL0078]|nr:hypothetical protein HK096_009670 [Nowakowskiella sp. JEL0078]